jgi:hypothetical protein
LQLSVLTGNGDNRGDWQEGTESAVKRKEEEKYNEIKQNKQFRLIMLP